MEATEQTVSVMDELRARAREWRTKMRDGATGPLRIASGVIEVVERWSDFKDACGGVSADAWLTSPDVFGPGLGTLFWRRRADAVRTLDPTNSGAVVRCIDHEAAVWLASKLDAAQREATLFACYRYAKSNGRAVSKSIARDIYQKTAKVMPKAKTCAECERLRALLAANGIAAE